VSVASVGPVTVGTALWQVQGQTMVTVMVKMTLAIPSEGLMTLVEPEPLRLADEHEPGQPTGSLVGARETAPLLQRVDVVLTGHAHAPEGATVTTVRLMIAGDGGTLLDKALMVTGNRDGAGTPKPVGKLKLGYERAFGGIGFAENPLGTGYESGDQRLPNITYPTDPEGRTAGFGAIPASFPVRKKLLGDTPRSALAEPIVAIHPDFDWGYFQAAPQDQQLEALQGNEWVLLAGFHPTELRLPVQLPGAKAVAKIYGHDQAGVPDAVPLRIDMIHIDADAQRCSLVWRGSFPVTNVELVGGIVVAGGLESPDNPMLWPETVAELEDAIVSAEPPAGGAPAATPSDQTLAIDGDRAPDADELFGGTVAMDGDALAAQTLPFADRADGAAPPKARAQPADPTVMPFKASSEAPASDGPPKADPTAAAPLAAQPDNPFEGTVAIDASQLPDPEASPFAMAPAGKPVAGDGAAKGIPGAPWANAGAAGSPAEPAPAPPAEAGTPPAAEAVAPPAVVPAMVPADQQAALAADGAADATEQEAAQEAERQAKLEAERQAKAELETRAKAEAEQKAQLEAERLAAIEAEERRRVAAEKFQKEQDEARKERERRAAEKAKAKREAAKTLRQDMYGSFKRKK